MILKLTQAVTKALGNFLVQINVTWDTVVLLLLLVLYLFFESVWYT